MTRYRALIACGSLGTSGRGRLCRSASEPRRSPPPSKYGVPHWISNPTIICLAIAGPTSRSRSVARAARLLMLERPVERSELLKDESAAVHEKAVLLHRAILWLLLSVAGVVASAVIAIE